jgi:hypothetical protein
MYTGTLIDELIATVERTEARVDTHSLRLLDDRSQEEKLAYWYAVAQQEVAQLDSSLAGWHKGGTERVRSCGVRPGRELQVFRQTIDNSRLVKMEDPQRSRRDETIWSCSGLPVPAGDDFCLAAFQSH